MKDKKKVERLLPAYNLSVEHANYCKASFAELRPRYHNEEHCYSTALTFHELSKESEISAEDARNGFVAALYHDAQHLMAKDDDLNIKSAIDWLKRIEFPESDVDLKRIARLIRATNNSNSKFYNKTERLLHDADILQTVKGSLIENLIWQKRLAEEMASNITLDQSIKFVTHRLHCPEAIDFLRKNIFEKMNPKG